MTSPNRFGSRIAARYDELRPLDAGLEGLLDELDGAGDLRGRRVLDVGCGTGAIATALVQQYGCEVHGVDSSPEMLAVARGREVPGATFDVAAAERLPFADGTFERALMRSVVHHLDRRAAFPEAQRVLVSTGRLVIHNIDPDGLEELWYKTVRVERTAVDRRFDRETALRKLRGRHTSSFDLLEEDEIEAGLARAQRELPDEVRYRLQSLLIVAYA